VPHGRETERLVLGGAGLGELEGDAAAGELAVDLGVGVEAVVDAAALLLVEDDLEGLVAVLLGAEALADDLDGVDEVGEDGVVDGGQGAAVGALLLLAVAGAGGALGARQDAARGQEEDVAVGELLLELTGEAGMVLEGAEHDESGGEGSLPLLDAVEALQGGDGDKDDDSLLAVADLDLIKTRRVSVRAPGRNLGPLPVLSRCRESVSFLVERARSLCVFLERQPFRAAHPYFPTRAIPSRCGFFPAPHCDHRCPRVESIPIVFQRGAHSRVGRIAGGRRPGDSVRKGFSGGIGFLPLIVSLREEDGSHSGQPNGIACAIRPLVRSGKGRSSSDSHLTGRDELQGAEGDLEVGSVRLKIVESLSDALLELGGLGPRGAVGGDLVEGGAGHLDWSMGG
jgi:hypothetical protein